MDVVAADTLLLLHGMGWGLVLSLVTGTLVGGLLWLLLAVLRRRSAWARYALCCGSLVLVVGTLLQSWDAVHTAYDGHAHTVVMLASDLMARGAPSPTGALPGGWESAALDRAIESAHDGDVIPWIGGDAVRLLGPALALAALAWIFGSLWNLAGLAHALRRVRGLRRRATRPVSPRWAAALDEVERRVGVRRPIRLAVSAEVDGPVLVGWWHPVILIPPDPHERLSDAEISAVLAHEVAHIRRGDYLVNVVQMLVEAIMFYHPVVHWIGERVRDEREYCSDDIAHRATEGSVSSYLGALATLESLRMGRDPEPVMAAGGRSLLERIRRLADSDRIGQPRWDTEAAAVVLGLLLLWTPALVVPKQAHWAAAAVMKHELVIPNDYERMIEDHGLDKNRMDHGHE